MILEINETNLKEYLKNEKLLTIDSSTLKAHDLSTISKIQIKGIHSREIVFWMNNIDLGSTNLEIQDCKLGGFFIESSAFPELALKDVNISEYSDQEIKFVYKSYIDNSKIGNISVYFSTFNNGFLIRKNSFVKSVSFYSCTIDLAFTHHNSDSDSVTIESSKVDNVNIERSDYPDEGAKARVDKIHVFRTQVLKGIKIAEIPFKELQLHKLSLSKVQKLNEYSNEIHIRTPKGHETVDEIMISESNVDAPIVISVNKLLKLNLHGNSLASLRFNFWSIRELLFSNCKFKNYVYWGFANRLKVIENFEIRNTLFESEFYISDTAFVRKLALVACNFQKYPSFFSQNEINEGCQVDFNYTNLTNFIFKEIDFSTFSFMSIDITNATFQDCTWRFMKGIFLFERSFVFDEMTSKSVDQLVRLKGIYSKLKSNLQKTDDFISHGLFHAAEQEVKRKIAVKKRNYSELILLNFHKGLSSYDESFLKPIVLTLVTLILFATLYLFTGFHNGDRIVEYDLQLDWSNASRMSRDFLHSLFFSLKNLVPFNMGSNFYLFSDKHNSVTQIIELFHRIINLTFVAGFTAALIKYLRK